MFGTAGGPLLLGWLYDHAGGYDTSYAVAAACSLTGSVVLAWGGARYRARRVSRTSTPTSAVSSRPVAGSA